MENKTRRASARKDLVWMPKKKKKKRYAVEKGRKEEAKLTFFVDYKKKKMESVDFAEKKAGCVLQTNAFCKLYFLGSSCLVVG